MEQLKDDIRRAGLMSTPNSEVDKNGVCPPPVPAIHAIVWNKSGTHVTPNVLSSFGNDLDPDSLILSGNFTSSASYAAHRVNADRIVVDLPDWTGPPEWEPAVYSAEGFNQAFRDDQYVRIANQYGSAQFLPVTSVDGEARAFEIGGQLRFSVDGTCGLTGTGDYMEVNPIQHVLYRIEPRNPGEVADLETDLIRSYYDPSADEPIEGTDVVVGQNIVDFQVWFTVQDPVRAGPLPDDPDLSDDEGPSLGGVTLDGEIGARPDLVRVAAVRLCARADREDQRWRFRPRADGGPLLSVNLDDNRDASARVTCLTSEVEIVNLSLRNLRG